MSYQTRPYFCAPAALQIALRFWGLRKGQETLARLAQTTPDGTDEQGIIGAATALGFHPSEVHTGSRKEARDWLLTTASVAPLILCVDQWEHWVCVAGQCGDRVTVFDPSVEIWNTKTRGVWPVSVSTLLKRWRAAGTKKGYYGIAIVKQ